MTKPESQPANPVPPKTVLILGASGMLGHMLIRVLSPRHRVIGTTSSQYKAESPLAKLLDRESWIGGIDVRSFNRIDELVREIQPNVVINCVGVIKQKMESSNITDAITINSLFPHHLANLCQSHNSRLIHFSTDCVFEGTPGIKWTSDTPNATDLYGTTKRLGEIDYAPGLTLRTGFVGRQLAGSEGLFEWVRSQKGNTINGYVNAIYSGLTTKALSLVVTQIIEQHPELYGLHQVASSPINKFDLINKLNKHLNLGLSINPYTEFWCDRSLDGTEFISLTGIAIPSWDQMLDEFAADQNFYINN
jgi:dTDP-4-dehydrorhamnose reductase